MNAILLISLCLAGAAGEDKATVLVVVGAEGSAEYGAMFRAWSDNWRTAAEKGSADFHAIGIDPAAKENDRDIFW